MEHKLIVADKGSVALNTNGEIFPEIISVPVGRRGRENHSELPVPQICRMVREVEPTLPKAVDNRIGCPVRL